MTEIYDLIIRNGQVLFPWGNRETDIGVKDGRIASFRVPSQATAAKTLNAAGLHVLPGLIDSHVHFRDPGDPQSETLETGTKGALLGGITAVFDMPNTKPPLIGRAELKAKQERVESVAYCDTGLYLGATKTNAEELAALEYEAGVAAIKVFAGASTGTLLVDDDASLEKIMQHGHKPIAYHSEDNARLTARKALFAEGSPYRTHAGWRDPETAFIGTKRILALSRKHNRAAHILHVSTAEEIQLLAAHRDIASVEVLANHLTLSDPEDYERLQGYAVANPPVRDKYHRQALWQAVRNGSVDVISSDHAPHPKAAKERPWPSCASGMTGVQTLLPLMLNHVAAGKLTLNHLVDLMAAGPARIFRILNKGRISVGFDADFTLVDLKQTYRIKTKDMVSPCGWTPFDGKKITGRPVITVLRGEVVMQENTVIGPPSGQLLRFH